MTYSQIQKYQFHLFNENEILCDYGNPFCTPIKYYPAAIRHPLYLQDVNALFTFYVEKKIFDIKTNKLGQMFYGK